MPSGLFPSVLLALRISQSFVLLPTASLGLVHKQQPAPHVHISTGPAGSGMGQGPNPSVAASWVVGADHGGARGIPSPAPQVATGCKVSQTLRA